VADSVTTTGSTDDAISPPRLELRRALEVSFLILATVLILFARRPDQFLHPTLWVEDTFILREYVNHGWWSLLEPLNNGYYILISKIVAFIAFKTSFSWAPQIELFLIVAFTCAVIVSVALSPTHLQWPFLCAVAVLIVPSDPEVFAVSMYGFWWAGILLLLALFWRSDARLQWLRWLYIVIGGLSSPIIVVVAGLLAVRAVFEKKPSEYFAAGLGVPVSLIQFVTIHGSVPLNTMKFGLGPFALTIQRFFGLFFIPKIGSLSSCVGFAVLISLVFIAWLFFSASAGRYWDLCLNAPQNSRRRDPPVLCRPSLFFLSVHTSELDHDLASLSLQFKDQIRLCACPSDCVDNVCAAFCPMARTNRLANGCVGVRSINAIRIARTF
jgi:hypothetical protein